MSLPRIQFKKTCKYLSKKCKEFGVLVWENIRRIRSLPSWIRATVVFIFYTLATKPIEQFAEVLDKVNTLSSNMTALAEYLHTSSKDLWFLILQVLVIIIFVALATWLWGDDNKKEIQELKDVIKEGDNRIIEEIKKGRQDESQEKDK